MRVENPKPNSPVMYSLYQPSPNGMTPTLALKISLTSKVRSFDALAPLMSAAAIVRVSPIS